MISFESSLINHENEFPIFRNHPRKCSSESTVHVGWVSLTTSTSSNDWLPACLITSESFQEYTVIGNKGRPSRVLKSLTQLNGCSALVFLTTCFGNVTIDPENKEIWGEMYRKLSIKSCTFVSCEQQMINTVCGLSMKSWQQYPGYSAPHLFIVSASYVLQVGMVMKGWEILRNGVPGAQHDYWTDENTCQLKTCCQRGRPLVWRLQTFTGNAEGWFDSNCGFGTTGAEGLKRRGYLKIMSSTGCLHHGPSELNSTSFQIAFSSSKPFWDPASVKLAR